MSYHVKTTLCHDKTTYDISWQLLVLTERRKSRCLDEKVKIRSMYIISLMHCGMQSLMMSSVQLEKNNAPTFRHT